MRARESLALPRPLIKVVSGEREFDLYERYFSPNTGGGPPVRMAYRLYAVVLSNKYREGVGAAE